MVMSTVTSKGQTTIPVQIREFLNLHAGDKIDFIKQADGRVLLSTKKYQISELENCLPRPKKSISIEEMNVAIRNHGGVL